eukprot:15441830-Alexandrium_andersonii.AAC.1
MQAQHCAMPDILRALQAALHCAASLAACPGPERNLAQHSRCPGRENCTLARPSGQSQLLRARGSKG